LQLKLSRSEAQLTTADVAQDDDDLFSFMNSAARQAAASPLAREVEEFMESKSTSLLSLGLPTRCQSIRKGQLYTAQQCSCGTSIARMILSPRRCKISDRLFDKMVFLKCRAK